MSFSVSWHTLLDEIDDRSDDAARITLLSHVRFHVADVHEYRVVVTFNDSGERQSLQRDQFETLYHRIELRLTGSNSSVSRPTRTHIQQY